MRDNTICLVIFVDGYQPKNVRKAHQVMINCLVMNIHPKYKYKDNVAILGFTDDIPGIAQLINFVRHTSTYGCRICLVVADVHTEHVRHGQYFSTEAAERTMESLLQGDE
ncbi:hypothetical protein A0J61_10910, partial [Choanephora cucurbitarum]